MRGRPHRTRPLIPLLLLEQRPCRAKATERIVD
jgi:hypothetical protein